MYIYAQMISERVFKFPHANMHGGYFLGGESGGWRTGWEERLVSHQITYITFWVLDHGHEWLFKIKSSVGHCSSVRLSGWRRKPWAHYLASVCASVSSSVKRGCWQHLAKSGLWELRRKRGQGCPADRMSAKTLRCGHRWLVEPFPSGEVSNKETESQKG